MDENELRDGALPYLGVKVIPDADQDRRRPLQAELHIQASYLEHLRGCRKCRDHAAKRLSAWLCGVLMTIGESADDVLCDLLAQSLELSVVIQGMDAEAGCTLFRSMAEAATPEVARKVVEGMQENMGRAPGQQTH